MPKEIKMHKLSNSSLLEIIQLATEELQRRASVPNFEEPQEDKWEKPALSPSADEIRFILNCFKLDYVHAEAKDRWRELSRKYPQWFAYRRYPESLRGSDFKRWKTYYSPNSNEKNNIIDGTQ